MSKIPWMLIASLISLFICGMLIVTGLPRVAFGVSVGGMVYATCFYIKERTKDVR